MTQETHTEINRKRRVKQNKVFSVFPVNDAERTGAHGNKVLTFPTRQDVANNINKLYCTARNPQIYVDHTVEIRKRVAEKIRRKRIEELKSALRAKAFLNPTPENWDRYREICDMEDELEMIFNIENSDQREYFRSDQSNDIADNGEQHSPLKKISPSMIYSRTRSDNGGEARNNCQLNETTEKISKPIKGILRKSKHETNQFVRPWAEPKFIFSVATWEPVQQPTRRYCRRVRFKDEEHGHADEGTCGRIQRCQTPYHLSGLSKDSAAEMRQDDGPERLYYDTELCKSIPTRLGLQFKSEACKRFHLKYTDPVPDQRDFRSYHKRYFFNGFHSTAFRG